jgi:glutathione S-transferase
MLKLYGGARSRASIVRWYLEELALPYEFVLLDMQTGEHRQPSFLTINPIGKVPAITDGDFQLWESGAILLYLAEKYDAAVMTVEQRAEVAQWVMFANATLAPGIFDQATRAEELPRYAAVLNQILEQQPFLLGDRLTAADIAVGATLSYAEIMLKLDYSGYEALTRYLKALAARPPFQQTIAPAGR